MIQAATMLKTSLVWDLVWTRLEPALKSLIVILTLNWAMLVDKSVKNGKLSTRLLWETLKSNNSLIERVK